MLRSSLLALLGVSLLLPAAAAQTDLRQGRLHVVWDGEPTPQSPEGTAFFLTREDGSSVRLSVTGDQAERLEGLDRQRVEITGGVGAPVSAIRALGGAGELNSRAAAASANFVTILCKYADAPAEPFGPEAIRTMVGGTYPGMAHFYAELAENPTVMTGNKVVGWYVLPKPRSSYIVNGSVMFPLLAQDCAAAADADVDFSQFVAVNAQLNGELVNRSTPPFDPLSYGGSATLTVDGVQRVMGFTWLAGGHARNYVVYAHEMGHGLGWPHSSGQYGQEYDSRWDLMSAGYLHPDPVWGTLSIHTIAPYKDRAGWLPAERRWTPQLGTVTTGRIERNALPGANGYRIASIDIAPNVLYSVETRKPAGYDTPLPGEAVVIHRVQNGRAYVIDPDLNGNPNDAGAQWLPGETFNDSMAGVQISVESVDATSFGVRIVRGWGVEIEVQGPGTVSGGGVTGCANSCTAVATARGAWINLTPTPGPNAAFLGWSGDCTGTVDCGLTMNGPRRVTARFGVPNPLTITSAADRPGGLVGAVYSDVLQATGGTGTYRWKVISGARPTGLALDSVNGAIGGVATAAGEYRPTIEVRSGTDVLTREFAIRVAIPQIVAASILDQLLGAGFPLSADEVRYLDLIGNQNGRLDVGDVRAWIALNPAASAAAGLTDLIERMQ